MSWYSFLKNAAVFWTMYSQKIPIIKSIDKCILYSKIIVQEIEQNIVQWKEDVNMLAVNYSTIRNNLKYYCDKATDSQETVIVTRKDEKNVVIISLEKYNQLEKAARNAEYLAMIDRSIAQLEAGKGQLHELIEVEDE